MVTNRPLRLRATAIRPSSGNWRPANTIHWCDWCGVVELYFVSCKLDARTNTHSSALWCVALSRFYASLKSWIFKTRGIACDWLTTDRNGRYIALPCRRFTSVKATSPQQLTASVRHGNGLFTVAVVPFAFCMKTCVLWLLITTIFPMLTDPGCAVIVAKQAPESEKRSEKMADIALCWTKYYINLMAEG